MHKWRVLTRRRPTAQDLKCKFQEQQPASSSKSGTSNPDRYADIPPEFRECCMGESGSMIRANRLKPIAIIPTSSRWDRVFGTYTPTVDFDRLSYGLDGFDDANKQTLPALLKLPFS